MGAWGYAWMKSTCTDRHFLMAAIVSRVLMENQFTTGD